MANAYTISPEYNVCHTFLLDTNYKILSTGSPIVNPSIRQGIIPIHIAAKEIGRTP